MPKSERYLVCASCEKAVALCEDPANHILIEFVNRHIHTDTGAHHLLACVNKDFFHPNELEEFCA